MKIWHRVLLILASVGGLYALWRFPPTGIVTVLIGVGAAWLGRSIYRSKLAANPAGENRDYSLQPVFAAVLRCVGWFAVALLWTALIASAIRRNYIPDDWLGVAVLFGPALILGIISVWYLIQAWTRFQVGGEPPAR
jgi:hypothetical protein